MNVRQILGEKGSQVVTIDPSATLGEAAKLLDKYSIGALLIINPEGDIVGILSERDIVRGIASTNNRGHEAQVRDFMTADIHFCTPSDSSDDLMNVMTEKRVRHLPVLEDGALAGIVSIGDIVEGRIRQMKSEQDSLSSYIAGVA